MNRRKLFDRSRLSTGQNQRRLRNLHIVGSVFNRKSGLRVLWRAALGAVLTATTGIGAPQRVEALTNVVAEWDGSVLRGRAYNSPHPWGYCDVQDYNGGTWGWYMRVGRPFSADNFHVRHGMLEGWIDNGGATGTLRCPTSQEYPFAGGARQDFQGGTLFWYPGMSSAQRTSPQMANAIAFAMRFKGQWGGNSCKAANLGSNGYVGGYSGGQCKQFMNCVIYGTIGKNPALGYAATGAVQVSASSMRPGDIIENASPAHTAMVVRKISNTQVEVIDSNWGRNELVSVHLWTFPSTAKIWRFHP